MAESLPERFRQKPRKKSYERINGTSFVSRINTIDSIHLENQATGARLGSDAIDIEPDLIGCRADHPLRGVASYRGQHQSDLNGPGQGVTDGQGGKRFSEGGILNPDGNPADRLYAFLAYSQAQDLRTKQNSFLEAIIKRSNLSTGIWFFFFFLNRSLTVSWVE